MSAAAVLIWFLIGVVVSIAVGNKLRINIGLVAIAFAFLLGVFGLGMKTGDFINLWPTKILFTIIGICWLFGYANENGTLRQITLVLVYRFRRFPSLIPWIFFFIAGLICMTGASPYAPNAVLMPIIISICLATNLNPLFGALMVNVGSYLGAQVPWGQGASIQRGVLEVSVYGAETEQIIMGGFWSCFIFALVAGVAVYLFFRGWKAKITDVSIITNPEPMNAKQKQTLVLIALLVVLMIVPSLLGNLGVAALGVFAKKLDISLVCMFLACIAGVLRLADDKVVVTKHVPWATIAMLGGVSMLVGVATQGGAVDLIGTWIGGNVSTSLIVPMFVLLGAFMSVFVAGATVVTPTLFALVPAVAAASGASYAAIYHGIAIGANASAVSPFSGGGSLTLANIKQDDIRDKMFLPLIYSAAGLSVLAALLAALGLY